MKNKKKVTLLGVALAVAVIALAGVGYATHNAYQGSLTTTGVDNDYDVDYVVVKFTETNDNAYNGFVAATDFELTWNTTTAYVNSAQKVTYAWQASDTLAHGLVITATDETDGTDSDDADSYTLTATVAGVGDDGVIATGYKLYYKTAQDTTPATSTTGWTLYTSTCALKDAGVSVSPGAIGSTAVTQWITWVVIPTTPAEAAPETAVTIGEITYLVEASQTAPSP